MSVVLIVVLERRIKSLRGLDGNWDGTLLLCDRLSSWENADEVAVQFGLTPLSSFESMSVEQAKVEAEQAARSGWDTTRYKNWQERWFAAAEGLETVLGLLRAARERPELVKVPERWHREDIPVEMVGEMMAYDLERIDKVLKAAESRGIRFHLR